MNANPYRYVCPHCGFHLNKKDEIAQRYEHDQKHHPLYWCCQNRLITIEEYFKAKDKELEIN
jgi:hypothetical protein